MLLFFKLFMAFHIGIYRLSGGRIMGKIMGTPVLLLTTTGRKTGKTRTKPLGYFKDGNAYLVVASAGGDPQHPAWYFNLVSNPAAMIETPQKINVIAREAADDEYERLWQLIVSQAPAYERYRTATGRKIPLLLLTPQNARAA
jgi:deazaflavin-dependent oxidoreductase (nitroreductase family)